MRKSLTIALLMLSVARRGQQAFAWDDSGHRMVYEEAIRALPADMLAFLRSASGITDVGEYSRESDLRRGSGDIHDAERAPVYLAVCGRVAHWICAMT